MDPMENDSIADDYNLGKTDLFLVCDLLKLTDY